MSRESLPPIEERENFEEKAGKVWYEARQEVLSHLCTPGQDDERCMRQYGDAFDVAFKRAIDAKPKLVDLWEEERAAYIERFIVEVKGEVDRQSLDTAA